MQEKLYISRHLSEIFFKEVWIVNDLIVGWVSNLAMLLESSTNILFVDKTMNRET